VAPAALQQPAILRLVSSSLIAPIVLISRPGCADIKGGFQGSTLNARMKARPAAPRWLRLNTSPPGLMAARC